MVARSVGMGEGFPNNHWLTLTQQWPESYLYNPRFSVTDQLASWARHHLFILTTLAVIITGAQGTIVGAVAMDVDVLSDANKPHQETLVRTWFDRQNKARCKAFFMTYVHMSDMAPFVRFSGSQLDNRIKVNLLWHRAGRGATIGLNSHTVAPSWRL